MPWVLYRITLKKTQLERKVPTELFMAGHKKAFECHLIQ